LKYLIRSGYRLYQGHLYIDGRLCLCIWAVARDIDCALYAMSQRYRAPYSSVRVTDVVLAEEQDISHHPFPEGIVDPDCAVLLIK